MLIQLEQIENIPVSAYNGNVQFFNQNHVTFCNSSVKTLLGIFQFDTDLGFPKINRVATVSGFGSWQPSNATQPDSLYITAYTKDGNGATINLLNKTIQRSQLDFQTGYFNLAVDLNIIANDTVTLDLRYWDTKGTYIETGEYTSANGINLASQKVYVEVNGQMNTTVNPIAGNAGITSNINLVQNPSFEQELSYWNTDPNGNTSLTPDPKTGNYAVELYGGAQNIRSNQTSVDTATNTQGYIYQNGIFQTGKVYLVEFYSKNTDSVRYAANVNVPSLIAQPNNYNDDSQSMSIVQAFAYNPVSKQTLLIGSVKTGKNYTKASFTHTAVAGYTAIYFTMSPASIYSASVLTSQSTLYRQVLEDRGIPITHLPYDPDYAIAYTQTYAVNLRAHLDDVRVSEIAPTVLNPLNPNNKEIRLRNFTTQYIS